MKLFLKKIFYNVLSSILKLFIKSQSIPENFINNLDLSRPIIYLLSRYSKIDLLILRIECLKKGLPDPLKIIETDNNESFYCCFFVHDRLKKIITFFKTKIISIEAILNTNLKTNMDTQIVPVLLTFGRIPYSNKKNRKNPKIDVINKLLKIVSIFWLGRDTFIFFSAILLSNIFVKFDEDINLAKKLFRLSKLYFYRQYLSAVGPIMPNKNILFSKLLSLESIIKIINNEVINRKISYNQVEKSALKIMKEITADFTYLIFRLTDRVMGLILKFMYKKIHVNGIDQIRNLARSGYILVYLPCHRSHMDYLLLSYIIYHQGLAPPRIVAGINLNIWPIGLIFRHLGAFFVRRKFKNKLYSVIFREYLGELFSKGFSIKYFIEGSRSRTGRLLEPKTGMLTMTIQSMFPSNITRIVFIPIFIGYEYVFEVNFYNKELYSKNVNKSFLKILLNSLHNFGHSYINFGKPLFLSDFLNVKKPGWRNDPLNKLSRPWIAPLISDITFEIATRINSAGAVNAMSLCITALISAKNFTLTRKQLIKQIKCYQEILRNVPYSRYSTVPDIFPEMMLKDAINMKKFIIKHYNDSNEIISLPKEEISLFTYYRNNIQHMLIIPSLVATIILKYENIIFDDLLYKISIIYPLLRRELFLHWDIKSLPRMIKCLVIEMKRQDLLIIEGQSILLNLDNKLTLQLLASGIYETLQRYLIVFTILNNKPSIKVEILEQNSCNLAKYLFNLNCFATPDLYNKLIFNSLITILRSEKYITNYITKQSLYRIQQVYLLLVNIVTQRDIKLLKNIIDNFLYEI